VQKLSVYSLCIGDQCVNILAYTERVYIYNLIKIN